MPRKTSHPSYRLHTASGKARTIVNGKHVYRGTFGYPESRQKYARILAEATLRAGTPDSPNRPESRCLLVSEMLVVYLKLQSRTTRLIVKRRKSFAALLMLSVH